MIRSKFTKFLSFLKQQIGFSSIFVSLFSAMRHNSSVLFQLKFYMLSTKGASESTNLAKFHLSSIKSEILHLNGILLSNSYKVSSKKVYTEELFIMTLKSDTKFKEKLTCGFKYDMKDLVNFDPATQKSKSFTSMGYFCPKYISGLS